MQVEERHKAAAIAGSWVGAWNPLEVPGFFAKPRWVTRDSAWDAHIPFGMGLMAMMRPKVVVELGTHGGDSYCAFCQGMEMAGVDGKCFAVDTWKGDGQTGFYGEEVLEKLREHHMELYGEFSTLLRMEFSQARGAFGEGTVDVLHIDGEHGYEAVRRDYEQWKRTVARGGVVLLHDTAERAEGFGVWRLWEELLKENVGFEFLHGHGLGVLFPRGVPAGMRGFVATAAAHPAEVRGLFEALGKRVEAEREEEILREALARERTLWGRAKGILRRGRSDG